MNHVFISYSKKNKTYARKLAASLLEAGFDVWIDDRIDFGDNWEKIIFKSIDDCAAFLVIMTPESYESGWVQRECHYAEKRNKAQFPVLLDGEEFPRYGPTQFMDVRDGSLPSPSFYNTLAQYSPRNTQVGADITEISSPPPFDNEVRQEIANPQSPDSMETTISRSKLFGTGWPVLITAITLVIIILVALLSQRSVFNAPTATDDTQNQTETISAGITETPPVTDVFSLSGNVSQGGAVLHSAPGIDAPAIASLPSGEALSLLERTTVGGAIWVKTRTTSGTIGWIFARGVRVDGDLNLLPVATETPPATDIFSLSGSVSQGGAVLHAAPGINAPAIASLPSGEDLKLLERTTIGGAIWVKASTTSGTIGWIFAPGVRVDGDLNLLPVGKE